MHSEGEGRQQLNSHSVTRKSEVDCRRRFESAVKRALLSCSVICRYQATTNEDVEYLVLAVVRCRLYRLVKVLYLFVVCELSTFNKSRYQHKPHVSSLIHDHTV
jgi:hypothetical protein